MSPKYTDFSETLLTTRAVKNAPPTGGHVFLATGTNFKLCHDDRTINMASRVLTGGHVFPPTRTIFELIQDIIRTNHLTKFHNNRKINVAYRVFTMKNAPPPDIIRTNLLTKVLTKFYYSHIRSKINVASREKCPAFGSHVFQANQCLTKDIRKTSPPLGGHVFSLIWTIFKLANILTSKVFTRKTAPPLAAIFELSRGYQWDKCSANFMKIRPINVASRVFTRQMLTTYNAQRTKAITKSSP
ncbi:hypothetical protein DPMN_056138 [Dreissena polymorpha]|uniref:Uncharacterized protein n=1 Tax=Dreissena polymorpha TaxID=45954 RepID=A0A9D4CRZ9_DREPO|nr:hypothetical protein DPMN_056138 [Dreissena polymorpha]